MSEDAAAAARRIVAEVLERHGIGADEPAPPAPHAVEPSGRAGEPACAEPAPAPSPADPTPAEPAHAAAANAEDAGAIARRIVEEVLTGADAHVAAQQAPTQEIHRAPADAETPADAGTSSNAQRPADAQTPAGTGTPPVVEAHVEHVPAEGLSTQNAERVEVDVAADVPDQGATSAADIVRRIVAEVTSAGPGGSEGDASPDEAAPEPSEDVVRSEAEVQDDPPPGASRREPTRELDPSSHGGGPADDAPPASSGPVETEPTQQVAAPEVAGQTEPTQQAPVRSAPLESESTREVPRGGAGVSLLEADAEDEPHPEPTPGASLPAADEPGFEAVVYAPSPEEDPAPAPIEPEDVAPSREPEPHTLRWLLTSILGAIALAVLLPLAVGALRSLVAL